MSVPYHAWTHRPKAQGGTDPIESAATPCEWYRSQSTTNLTAGWTDIDWGSTTDSGHDSSASPPTFDINASANLVIAKSGLYSIEIGYQSMTLTADVNTVLNVDLRRIAGARPYSFRSTTSDPSVLSVPLLLLKADLAPNDAGNISDPFVNTHFILLPTAIDIDGACEIRLQLVIEEDGTQTAHSEPTFYLFVTRHGEAYEA